MSVVESLSYKSDMCVVSVHGPKIPRVTTVGRTRVGVSAWSARLVMVRVLPSPGYSAVLEVMLCCEWLVDWLLFSCAFFWWEGCDEVIVQERTEWCWLVR